MARKTLKGGNPRLVSIKDKNPKTGGTYLPYAKAQLKPIKDRDRIGKGAERATGMAAHTGKSLIKESGYTAPKKATRKRKTY